MPIQPTFPGVYIEEIPSGVRTITGVATSITAFIGRAQRGPVNKAITINNYGDFERLFGGLWVESTLGYAVRDFYLNGGSQGIIVRLNHENFPTLEALNAAREVANATTGATAPAAAAAARAKANTFTDDTKKAQTAANMVAIAAETAAAPLPADAPADSVKAAAFAAAPLPKAKLAIAGISLAAAYEGAWGNNLRAMIDVDVSGEVARPLGLEKVALFNLTVIDTSTGGVTERFINLTFENKPRRLDKVLEAESKLVRWYGNWPNTTPQEPKVVAAHTAAKNLEDALEATPPNDAAIAAARTALANALKELMDNVTIAEKDLAAKELILANLRKAVPPVPADITAAETAVNTAKALLATAKQAMAASDGLTLTRADFTGTGKQGAKEGLFALEQADLFNLLCLPPHSPGGDIETELIDEAAKYCKDRRAMLLVDPPSRWTDKDKAKSGIGTDVGAVSNYAALFFPRLKQPNPLRKNQVEDFVPCGAVAGIFARTDAQRGVWKAPAGQEATLAGVPQLSVPLTDPENGELNPLGINCLRTMPAVGRVVWGARTREGDDRLASEWKYIPVRRTALFIEESLYRGTQWVVFEPNDEPLWAQIRLNVGAFMQNLFRQGAFQGKTRSEAYFVKCDKETTTQNDINLGIVNIVVGFAPLKPAEFVIIKIQQMAGQIEA